MLYDGGSSNQVLCDNLEEWDGVGGRREIQEGGDILYLWLIHVDVWQRLTQYCKAIILQLKVNFKKFSINSMSILTLAEI